MARPATFHYQCAKFVRRPRVGVTAAALALVSLTLWFGVTMRALRDTVRQRERALGAQAVAQREVESARVETRESEHVTSFLQRTSASVHPRNVGHDVPVAVVLDEAAASVAEEFGADAEVESAIRTTIGESYMGLGRYDEVEAQGE